MPPELLPLVHAAGTHAEVGAQIGSASASAVLRSAAAMSAAQIEAARPYREVTERELPWLVEELDAVAAGAGADRLALLGGHRLRAAGSAVDADAFLLLLAHGLLLTGLWRAILLRIALLAFARRVGLLGRRRKADRQGEGEKQ